MEKTQKSVRRALDEMNASLRRKYELMREMLSSSTADLVHSRHRVGVTILEIRNAPDKYGARAVSLVALALGRDETTLYRYGQVAVRWDAHQIAALMKRENVFGEPLSWSHLIELAGIDAKSRRDELTERALTEGLSVRELASMIHDPSSSRLREGESPSMTSVLKAIFRVSESLLREAERWEETAGVLESPAPEQCTSDTLALLERASAAQATLGETCRTTLRRLERAKTRVAAVVHATSERRKTSSPRAPEGRVAPRPLAGSPNRR